MSQTQPTFGLNGAGRNTINLSCAYVVVKKLAPVNGLMVAVVAYVTQENVKRTRIIITNQK
jgi:hypothetical protein